MSKIPDTEPVGRTIYGVEIRPFKHGALKLPAAGLPKIDPASLAPKRRVAVAPVEELSLEQLLEIVTQRAPAAKTDPEALKGSNFKAILREWTLAFGFRPGTSPTLPPSYLFRHFSAWLAGEVGLPPSDSVQILAEFGARYALDAGVARDYGQGMKYLGFNKARIKFTGQTWAVSTMDDLSAQYLRAWSVRNPQVGENPWKLGNVANDLRARRREEKVEELLEVVQAEDSLEALEAAARGVTHEPPKRAVGRPRKYVRVD